MMKAIKYNFEKELHDAFIKLNLDWINRMFKVEEVDKRMLSEIDNSVKNGSHIYFVLDDVSPVACLMLYKVDDFNYELVKFASSIKGAGSLCLSYALKDATSFAKRIFIATNSKCEAACHLYEKFGFHPFSSDKTFGFSSSRVNLLYEKMI